jgi:hypothetical protein
MKCFCGQEFTLKQMKAHKESCLEFIKNELRIRKSQIATFSVNLYDNKVSKIRFNREAEYLFHKLRQSLAAKASLQNKIQNVLLYLNCKLLDRESGYNFSHIQFAFEDLEEALNKNYSIKCFIELNGLDYILLCYHQFNKIEINHSII